MGEETNFKQRYLDGEIEFEEIYRYVSRWKYSDDNMPLREVLGINGEEEDVWIEEGDEALQERLDAVKKQSKP
ncbi:hypothetical protein MUB23_02465 [Cuneatibacter sp. NSJ-177]|uniref:hypothetical protein n=1 Tax=Cuneatibacter sp. NSJ-177 TaxID=2931401 RepID=UPI001FD36B6C|nr:hypothetical protein [Cuneatibacter sp. NSJ-177]MCJ7834259.1 hypothetical protein [Cuneatibacter sp. NSJ-177]